MTIGEVRDMFAHCDPARHQDTLEFILALAARPDVDLRQELHKIGLAKCEGQRLYMARVKGGFADEE